MVQFIRISSIIFISALLISPLFVAQNHATIKIAQAQSTGITISEFMASNSSTLADEDGEFSDWIELYNGGSNAVNLQGFTLSDDGNFLSKWTFPNIILNADQYLLIFASNKDRAIEGNELHTNFKLSASGEYLALSDGSGTILTEFATAYPPQYADVSFGANAAGDQRYFNTPTGGSANGTGIYPYAANAPTSSLARGFYTSAQIAALFAQPGAQIYYTVDGSEPTIPNGTLYTGPLYIDGITTLRAISVLSGTNPSPVATFSYIFHDNVVDQAEPAGWPTGTVNNQLLDYEMDPNVVNAERDATKQALTQLPSVSIVTDLNNLFDPATGIYVNAIESGAEWERPISVEWINADNIGGFQIDAGVRIRGGYSRRGENPKHSFHLYFNGDYDGMLVYPIFGLEGVETFKRLDLRTPQNYAWSESGHSHNTFLREVWSRDTQAAMGQPYTRSNYLHLYINGHYWGIYMTQERVSQEYAADYFGGNEADYDVVKHYKGKGQNPDPALDGQYAVSDGNDAEWRELWQLIEDQVVTDEEYEQIAERVDLASLIDVNLIQFYTADYDSYRMFWWDWKRANNWLALRNRTGDGTKWRFFMHDAEHSLGAFVHDETEDRAGPVPVLADNEFYLLAYFNPGWLHQALMSNSQYLTAFQYRAWQHLKSENGALTAAAARARWDNRKAQVEAAILAESARWGDTFIEPPRGMADWQNEVAWVENNWFPNRTDTLVGHLQSYNLATIEQPPEPAEPAYPAAKMILNEYNGVVSDQILQEGGSDTFFGQVVGNGGDWFELVTVVDQLDIRGWTVEIWDADNFSGTRYRTDLLKFADQPLLANLRRGTILTISEDLADNVSYDPAGGDWWINLQANSVGDGSFFTPESQSNFDTNSKAWQLLLRDAAGNLVFGPAGEGAGNFVGGLGNAEVGKLEENPQSNISPISAYSDGTTSTFGAPNVWGSGASSQDFTLLRSVVPANTPTNTPTHTPTNRPTLPPTNTPVFTPQNTDTPTPLSTPNPSATQSPTSIATGVATNLPTNTPVTMPTEMTSVATVVNTATPANGPTGTPLPGSTTVTPIPPTSSTPTAPLTPVDGTPVDSTSTPQFITTPTPSSTETATLEAGQVTVGAVLQEDQVSVIWTFTADRQTIWFYVYRATTPDFNDSEKITIDFIPSHFSGTKVYEFADLSADKSKTYYYWVEQVYGSRATELHGPASNLVEGNGSNRSVVYLPLIQ